MYGTVCAIESRVDVKLFLLYFFLSPCNCQTDRCVGGEAQSTESEERECGSRNWVWIRTSA